jgi:hypothetical protein
MKNSPIEGSITFYGMTIQQSLVNLGHVFHKFPCMGEIIFSKSQFGRNSVVEESLVKPIYYKVSERPSSCIIPFKGTWFSERKCQLRPPLH